MSHPVAYVKQRQHPAGKRGALLSTHEVAAKARAARLDPQVRAWAIKQLRAAGLRQYQPKRAAQVLLEAQRQDKLWVPDPTDGEYIVSPECLLGTCGGIQFDGGDCDDLTGGYAAAVLSVGANGAAVVGQYSLDALGREVLAHVLGAVHDGTQWWYTDPSYPELAFGEALSSTREVWVDVMSGQTLCDGRDCLPRKVPVPPPPMAGQYVGVAGAQGRTDMCVVDDGPHVGTFVLGAVAGAAVAALATWALVRRK